MSPADKSDCSLPPDPGYSDEFIVDLWRDTLGDVTADLVEQLLRLTDDQRTRSR